MKNNKILIIVAPEGFRDEEYFDPKLFFEENSYQVVTASKGVPVATGKFGAEVDVDIDFREADFNNFVALVLVGGPGAYDYFEDKDIHNLIRDFFSSDDKIISAICIAPMILLKAGILSGRHVTVWDGDKKQSVEMVKSDVEYLEESVVEDENIITANGPAAAQEFAEAIINRIEEI